MIFIIISLYFTYDWVALWDRRVETGWTDSSWAFPQSLMQRLACHHRPRRTEGFQTHLASAATLQAWWDAGIRRLFGKDDVKCLVSKCFLIMFSDCYFLPCRSRKSVYANHVSVPSVLQSIYI